MTDYDYLNAIEEELKQRATPKEEKKIIYPEGKMLLQVTGWDVYLHNDIMKLAEDHGLWLKDVYKILVVKGLRRIQAGEPLIPPK